MNTVRLTSSPEPSRGLFLNRHASRSYVCVEPGCKNQKSRTLVQ